MRRSCAIILLLLAVLALFGSCGSGDEDSSASTTTTAAQSSVGAFEAPPPPARPTCELLSREEVGRVLGNPVKPGSGTGRDCLWGTDVDGGTGANVTVSKAGAGAAQECALMRDTLPKEAKREPVGGLGTSSIWVWEQLAVLTQGRLLACWDDSLVLVLITGEKEPDALRAAAVGLAEQAHARL